MRIHSTKRRGSVRGSVLLVLLSALGCSDSDRLTTYALRGEVTYEDGQPIEEGNIMFVAEGLPSGRGLIDAGRYELGTYESDDGIVAGTFQIAITVSPPVDFDPDGGKRPPKSAHAKYTHPETSGLTFEMTPESSGEFNIKLQREK